MVILLKLCVSFLIFLNFLAHNRAQDILGAILGGVQNGINLVNNNMGVGQRDYPDYGPPANRDISFSRSNEVSQSYQNQDNGSDEPYNSNSEQRREGDSNWSAEEYDKDNPNTIENKKRLTVNSRKIKSDAQNRSPYRHPSLVNENDRNKPIGRKPQLFKNQKPVPLVKEKLDSNDFINNVKDSLNPSNETTILNDGNSDLNDRSTTPIPLIFLVNSTVISNIPNFSQSDDSLNRNITHSTNTETNKIVEKDNKNVLKPLTKRLFFFQAKPVTPFNEEGSANETIYYIDLD